MQHAVELFIASAEGDQAIREELCIQLSPLVEAGILRALSPDPPETEISSSLNAADIVVLLTSPEALTPGSAVEVALREGLAMERARKAVVIPLRARPFDAEGSILSERTIYPRDGRSLELDPLGQDHREARFRDAIVGVITGVTLCHVMVGDIFLEQERDALAAAAFRRAIALAERLADEEPDDEDHLTLVAVARDRLGDALLSIGDGPSALAAFESARHVRDRLVRVAPNHHGRRRALARCHESIGEVLRAMGDKSEALTAYGACLELRAALALELGDAESQRDLYTTHSRIGHVHRAMGDLEAAIAAFRTGLALAEALVAESGSTHGTFEADVALFCFRAATVLTDGTDDDRREARELLHRARAIYTALDESARMPEGQTIWPPAVEALLDTLDA